MNTTNTSSDELDLKAVLVFIQTTFNKCLILLYKAIRFIVKFWIVILILILAGIGLGYYLDNQENSALKESSLLVQINNNSVNYTYNAIEKLHRKIKDRDGDFLAKYGFSTDKFDLAAIEVAPVVNINDLIDKYDDVNNSSLNVFVDIVPFDEDEEKMLESVAFLEEYKYHKIDIITGPAADPEIANKIIDYLNANKLVSQMGEEYFEITKERIAENLKTIEQMDMVITNYTDKSTAPTYPEQFVIERSMNVERVFEEKIELLDLTDNLRNELLKRSKTIVLLSNTSLLEIKSFMDGKRMMLFPFVFVFVFLLGALLLHFYLYMKSLAEADGEA